MKVLKTSRKDNKFWKKTLSYIPKGSQTLSKCPDQYVDGVHPKFIESGKGCYVYDHEGNKYIDFPMSLGPIILGHNNKHVTKAVIKQIKKGTTFTLPTKLETKLAQLINETIPCSEQVKFAKNGTDANLGAVRAARAYTSREKIMCCGYHGWGDWYAVSTSNNKGIPVILKDYIIPFEFNNQEDFLQKIEEHNPAGVIMEVCALTKPNLDFLKTIREICSKKNIVLIFDEIVTGYRWSLGGAQEYYNVIPDLCTVGKAMGNGYPISVVCGRKDIMNEFNNIFFSSTFGGECISITAAITTIEILQTKNYNYLWYLGNKLQNCVDEQNIDFGSLIGEGPRKNFLSNTRYVKEVFYQEMVRQGVLWGNVIYPTFAHSEKDIDYTNHRIVNALSFIKDNLNNLSNKLDGKECANIFRKNN